MRTSSLECICPQNFVALVQHFIFRVGHNNPLFGLTWYEEPLGFEDDDEEGIMGIPRFPSYPKSGVRLSFDAMLQLMMMMTVKVFPFWTACWDRREAEKNNPEGENRRNSSKLLHSSFMYSSSATRNTICWICWHTYSCSDAVEPLPVAVQVFSNNRFHTLTKKAKWWQNSGTESWANRPGKDRDGGGNPAISISTFSTLWELTGKSRSILKFQSSRYQVDHF